MIANSNEQGLLHLVSNQRQVEVSLDILKKRKSFLGAINLCIDLSGHEDKELYMSLGIDAGHWSNLRKGKGHFPPDKINELMDLCCNEAPLMWLAESRGYGLVVLQTESERRAEAAEQALADANNKVKMLTDLLQGRSPI